jgi:hypothetical protein
MIKVTFLLVFSMRKFSVIFKIPLTSLDDLLSEDSRNGVVSVTRDHISTIRNNNYEKLIIYFNYWIAKVREKPV